MCNNVTEDAGVVVNIPVLHVGDTLVVFVAYDWRFSWS